jgi:hypothetical protein
LDADDEWLPHKLSRSIRALDANPDSVLAYSDFYSIDPNNRTWGTKAVSQPPSVSQLFDEDWLVLPSTAVLTRAAFERCGGFCEKFRRPGGEDPYLWLRMREQGPFVYLPEMLVRYRTPAPADLGLKYAQGTKMLLELIRERYGKRALPLVRFFNRYGAAQLIASACSRLDSGDTRGALADLWRSVLLSPPHVLSGEVLRRIARPAAFGRALKSVFHPRPSPGRS